MDLQHLTANAEHLARSTLARPGVSPRALVDLAELCRRAGALEQARLLLEAAGSADGALANGLRRAFGLPHRPVERDAAVPEPFVRLSNVLEAEESTRLLERAIADLSVSEPSRMADDDGAHVDEEDRCSVSLPCSRRLAERFRGLVGNALVQHDVYARLGVEANFAETIDVAVTYYPNGAFFRAHPDRGATVNSDRRISFVYYFCDLPAAFSGGALVLYDRKGDQINRLHVTRVRPQHNTLIFFNSDAFHEVETVRTNHAEALGRFTVHGWVCAPARSVL